jgi:tetratricopeptide (TPR) repeat protein
MINILSNIHIPSSVKICAKSFGRTPDFDFNYDYIETFSSFCKTVSLKTKIDAIFIFYPEYNVLPPGMDDVDAPLVAFVSDWNLGYYPLKASLSRFDLIVSDKLGLSVLPPIACGVPVIHWNMYGYMPEQYGKISKSNFNDDVLFIGNVIPAIQRERAAFLKRILSMNDRLKVRVATNIRGVDYVDALANSKLIFNRSIRSEANMRVFEALAVNRMILIEESNQEISDYFEPGKECVLYNDETMEETLVEYVSDDQKRTKIEKAAAEKRESYSFVSRLDVLYEMILSSGILNGKRNRTSSANSKHSQIYNATVQALFSSGVQASESVFYADFNTMLNSCVNLADKGLLIRLQYALAKTGHSLREPVLDICKDIYRNSKTDVHGRIWNTFNFASLMEATSQFEAAEKKYVEVFEYISISDASGFAGIPCFIIGEEWYQEFNLFEYKDPLSGLQCKKMLLSSIVLTRLGMICVNKNSTEEALRLFKKAIEYYPQNSEANYWYGLLSCSSNKQIGYRFLKAAYDNNNFNPNYWNALLNAVNGIGRIDEAAQYKREMTLLKPLALSVYGDVNLQV